MRITPMGLILGLKPDGTCYIPRNVKVTKEGTFIDIVHSVTPNGVTRIEKTLGFVWGDSGCWTESCRNRIYS
jgi:hypothetical protein